MAADKIQEAKEQIEQGVTSPPSPLSVQTAENTTYWSKFFSTPQGKTIGALFVGFIIQALIFGTALLDGSKKISDLGFTGPIQVEVVKAPKLVFVIEEPAPTPIPLPQKPVGVVTFSEKMPPLEQSFWDGYRAKGYRVDHYNSTGPEAALWASLITKAGGGEVVLVTDTKNYLGGAKLTDKAAAAATIAKYAAEK